MSHKPIDIIKKAIENKRLSHAYLFYGDKGVDVEKHAFEAIKLLIESTGKTVLVNSIKDIKYFDLKIIEPNIDQKMITKEVVDNTLDKLYETSLEKDAIKILYIKDVDFGNKFSLNRLLKFVEEPVDNLIIFMTTNHIDKVISTIKSRTQNIFVKRENISAKIELLKEIVQENVSLIANIYPNKEVVSNLDIKLFNSTYDNLLEILEKSFISKFCLKEELFKLWTKTNSDFFINILQFFFYQLMVDIDEKNPLFPAKDKLIFEYKKKNLNCFKIQFMIEDLKKSLSSYANFTLQKINFLNHLENEIYNHS